MKLYHLETIFYGLDITTDILVRAYDEQQARELAAKHDKDNMWLDGNKVTINEIQESILPEVIFAFFTPA